MTAASSAGANGGETSDMGSMGGRDPVAAPMVWQFGLLGLVQGLLLWGLFRAAEHGYWPATAGPSLLSGSYYLTLALPLACYLTQGAFARSRRRWVFVAALSLLFALLGAHAGAGQDGRGISPAQALPALVAGFVLVPLVAGFDAASRRFVYARLFELAWRNAVLIPLVLLLTGLIWLLLWAGAWLMQSIGMDRMGQVLREPLVICLITAGGFGLMAGLALARAEALRGLRRFWLSLITWFLPLALLLAVLWVAVLPFSGLSTLFATRNSALYLLWFCLLTVTFANAAFQDGHEAPAFPPWLASAQGWMWLALPVLVLLADWALWLRVAQHGWTPDRIWGALVAALLSLHVLGYALAVLLRRHGAWLWTLPTTNIVCALLEVGALLLLISPLADVRSLAVASQVQRLQSGAVGPQGFDWNFLRFEAGPYGPAALKALQAQTGTDAGSRLIAEWATEALSRSDRHASTGPVQQDTAQALRVLREQVLLLPESRRASTLDAGLLERLSRAEADWNEQSCLAKPRHCALWIVDLDRDGQDEAVLLWERDSGDVQAMLYAREAAGWRKQGQLGGGPGSLADWVQAIKAGAVERIPPRWPVMRIGDRDIHLRP